MPKIYSADAVCQGAVPALDDLARAAARIEAVFAELYARGEIVGATSYGSFYEERPCTRASDVDWLLVFPSLEGMSRCRGYAELAAELQAMHIEFLNPMLPLECLAVKNHTIAPILHGIGACARRKVIGRDPLEIFAEYGIQKNDREMVERVFASFNRYFFEDLPTIGNGMREWHVAAVLQKAANHFLGTMRMMLILLAPPDDYSAPIDFAAYCEVYGSRLAPSIRARAENVHRFVSDYQNQLAAALNGESDVAAYASFLRDRLSIVSDAAAFILANVNLFLIDSQR